MSDKKPVPEVVTGAITINIDDDGGFYQLTAPTGDEGAVTAFGLPAVLTVDGIKYMAFLDETGEPDDDLGSGVFMLAPVESTEDADVDFGLAPAADDAADAAEEEDDEDAEEDDEDAPDAAA